MTALWRELGWAVGDMGVPRPPHFCLCSGWRLLALTHRSSVCKWAEPRDQGNLPGEVASQMTSGGRAAGIWAETQELPEAAGWAATGSRVGSWRLPCSPPRLPASLPPRLAGSLPSGLSFEVASQGSCPPATHWGPRAPCGQALGPPL